MPTADIPWMGGRATVNLVQIRPPSSGDHPATSTDPAGKWMYEDSAYQFVQMDQAARADGIHLTVNTAYRSTTYQTQLYEAYLAAKDRGENPSVVARPGTSDHERGFSVDLETGVPSNLRTASKAAKAASSRIYNWLNENAATYGFVNDVNSEPWHWTCKPTSLKVWDAAADVVTGGGGAAGLVLVAMAAAGWYLLKK